MSAVTGKTGGPEKIVNRSSNRSFGLFFSFLAVAVGVWPMLSGRAPGIWLLGIGALLFGLAMLRPNMLGPLNALWFEFGLLLHRILNPLILGLVFFTSVVPIGLALRMFGKDPLKRRFEPQLDSYWIVRDPPGPQADSLPRQF